MSALIELYSKILPESFPGSQIDALTSKCHRWRSLQNKRSRGEIPEGCFVKISSRKILILKQPFLEWLAASMPKL